MVEKINELKRKGFTTLEIWKAVAGSEALREEYSLLEPKADWSKIDQILSLCSQAKNGSDSERYQAIKELSKMLAPESVPVFITALNDSDNVIRHQALDALHHIGGEEAIEALRAIQEDSFFGDCVKDILAF